MRGLLLVMVSICVILAGCGDEEAAVATQPTTTASALGGIDDLAQEANRIEGLLEKRVRSLTEVDSLSDVSPELEGMETELERAADRLADLELSTELDSARDALADALRNLGATLGEVRVEIENLDVVDALDALGKLDLSDAEAAIAEIQRLADGA